VPYFTKINKVVKSFSNSGYLHCHQGIDCTQPIAERHIVCKYDADPLLSVKSCVKENGHRMALIVIVFFCLQDIK